MGYRTLADCVKDLHAHGMLKVIDERIDPVLEMGMVQRRAFINKAPALLFTNPANCAFPMLANLFGSMERLEFIFRDSLDSVKRLFEIAANPVAILKKPLEGIGLLKHLNHLRPLRKRYSDSSKIPVMAYSCQITDLPHLKSWPGDGGAFITLPLVYTEDPVDPASANLGMYRIQISGNEYAPDEIGLHYQLYRGIGIHHASALAHKRRLPVHIYVGGPPALTLAAVMPLPAHMNELMFAGLLGACRMELDDCGMALPVLGQADFMLQAEVGEETRPEGPFGDHLGYYSLRHEFPVAKVSRVFHRKDAIWPFTTVGRPPQEDTIFGTFIHELTKPLVGKVFEGVREVHAVDAAGVHPLLLAIGKERYTPWEICRQPRELLTLAMHLLGNTQTSLAKYLLIVAEEDAPSLSCHNVAAFLTHILERTDFSRDLHFLTSASCDTLDYCGGYLNEGSRLIWAAAGKPKRRLERELREFPDLPTGFGHPLVCLPGIMALSGPPHRQEAGIQDRRVMDELCPALASWPSSKNFPLVVLADDSQFCSASLENLLWVTFTRSDPATDTYGANSRITAKHWQCDPPLIIDARKKGFHAPPLEEDQSLLKRLEKLSVANGPLAGII